MILKQYGIKLKRVTIENIELIRQHRNSLEIQNFMDHKTPISKEQQIEWFQSINNVNNYYFLIVYNEQYVGLINAKNVSWTEKYGEGGIFLWEKFLYGTHVPIIASVILLNFSFFFLDFDKSYSRVLSNNSRAIAYNKALGYTLVPCNENTSNKLYILTRESYNQKYKKWKKYFSQISGHSDQLEIFGEVSNINHPSINKLLGA